jgi:hypothetical protein
LEKLENRMNINEKLLLIAASDEVDGLNRINAPLMDRPRFTWEHYIPGDLLSAWGELSEESRLTAFICSSALCELDNSSCS